MAMNNNQSGSGKFCGNQAAHSNYGNACFRLLPKRIIPGGSSTIAMNGKLPLNPGHGGRTEAKESRENPGGSLWYGIAGDNRNREAAGRLNTSNNELSPEN